MQIETSNWSGEGAFTQKLIDELKTIGEVVFLRVEDAPATRSEADYNFISNEIFVGFQVRQRLQTIRRFGILPAVKSVDEKTMSMSGLETTLAGREDIGPPDYSDESMIQYLKTERIIPPYQTRGYKLVELVRIYELGAQPHR